MGVKFSQCDLYNYYTTAFYATESLLVRVQSSVAVGDLTSIATSPWTLPAWRWRPTLIHKPPISMLGNRQYLGNLLKDCDSKLQSNVFVFRLIYENTADFALMHCDSHTAPIKYTMSVVLRIT